MSATDFKIVEVWLDAHIVEGIERHTGRKIKEAVEKIAKDYYKRNCKSVRILNRCTICDKEVYLELSGRTRRKTIKWMERAQVRCKTCHPQSSWKQVGR